MLEIPKVVFPLISSTWGEVFTGVRVGATLCYFLHEKSWGWPRIVLPPKLYIQYLQRLLPKPRWTRRWPLSPGLSPSSLSSSSPSRGWKSERVWTRGPRRQRDDEPSSADSAELRDAANVNGCDRLKDLQCPAFYHKEQCGHFFYLHGPILQTYIIVSNIIRSNIQGDPKKMSHKNFELKSLLEDRFYFSTCVLESEFPARFIWPL